MMTILFQVNSGTPLPFDILKADWILGIVVLPLFLYAIVASSVTLPAVTLARRVFKSSLSPSDYRSNRTGSSLHETLLSIISLISISTFILFTELHFGLIPENITAQLMWVINFGFCLIAVSLRFIVSFITGYLTGSGDLFSEYYYMISQFYKFLAIPLIFVNFLIPYMTLLPDKYLIIITLIFAFLLYLLRYIRLSILFINRSFSLFYLILYLCALEFTPVLILYRYLAGTV